MSSWAVGQGERHGAVGPGEPLVALEQGRSCWLSQICLIHRRPPWHLVDAVHIIDNKWTLSTCYPVAVTASSVPREMRAETRRPRPRGAVRDGLIAAGLELARAGGPDAVVLREATRMVGVVPNAAYRHFAGRDELLAAVSAAAMGELADRMAAGVAGVRGRTGRPPRPMASSAR